MTNIFIIILNFNGGTQILECLGALGKEKARVIVVDNDSADNSVQLIEPKFPKVKIIRNDKNLGYAAGCNVGIKYTLSLGAEAVLLLNQDALPGRGFLDPLLKNPADIVAPVIKFERAGEWIYDFGGKINWLFGRTSHIERKNFEARKSNDSNHRTAVDYVSGCCMLIKKPVWEKIGFLDERFFLYFEDADYCLRAKKAGFKIAVEPGSIITHRLVEKGKKPLNQHLTLLRSNYLFINKHIPLYRRKSAYGYLGMLFLKIIWNRLMLR